VDRMTASPRGDAKANHFLLAFDFIMRPEHDGQPFHVTPGDTGGATAWGIIRPTLADYRGVPVDQVTDDDIRALTRDGVRPIYERLFWRRLRCHLLPDGIDVVAFDFACLSGTGPAAVRLQRILGVADDGIIGPVTVEAARAAARQRGAATLLRQYHLARMAFYPLLSTYRLFGRGWEARARRCMTMAEYLLPQEQAA
jgi:lysozyme family protein